MKALDSSSPELDKIYLRILNDIPALYEEKTIRILQLLCSAKRPLTIEELVDAVAVRTDGEPYFDPKWRMPKFEEVTQFCSSLVEIVPAFDIEMDHLTDDTLPYQPSSERGAVQLAHSSVKKFLTPAHLDDRWAPFFQSRTVHASVAITCLCYTIQLGSFAYDRWDYPPKFPFWSYSAKEWMLHAAAVADMDEIVHELTIELFLHRKLAYRGWLVNSNLIYENMPVPAPLYAACRLGLIRLSRSILENGADPNADGGSSCPSASYAACERGEKEIINMLILKNADFSRQEPNSSIGGTPLGIACRRGHHDVVLMLLNHLHKSNIALQTWKKLYKSAITNACVGEHQSLILMLLTDISRVDSWNWKEPPFNPLTGACKQNSAAYGLRIILDHLNDADIDTKTWIELLQKAFNSLNYSQWFLHAESHEILLMQLQQLNINRHIKEQIYVDIFDRAIRHRNAKVLQVLLDYLTQDDIGGRIGERINSDASKKNLKGSADLDYHEVMNMYAERYMDFIDSNMV